MAGPQCEEQVVSQQQSGRRWQGVGRQGCWDLEWGVGGACPPRPFRLSSTSSRLDMASILIPLLLLLMMLLVAGAVFWYKRRVRG